MRLSRDDSKGVEIMLQGNAGLYELSLCQDYWDLPDGKCLENHVYELMEEYMTSEADILRIVEENWVVVTDVCCVDCQQYLMPKLPTELVEVRKYDFYQCLLCKQADEVRYMMDSANLYG